MRLKDPRDLPRVARHLQRDPVDGVKALRDQLQRLRPSLDPTRRPRRPPSTIATAQKSRCTSSATALTSPSSPLTTRAGEPAGKRHRRIRAHSATGQVAGAATEKPGLKPAHRPQTACPACVLPESPSSQSTEPKPAPGHDRRLTAQFHAPKAAAQRSRLPDCSLEAEATAGGGALLELPRCSSGY